MTLISSSSEGSGEDLERLEAQSSSSESSKLSGAILSSKVFNVLPVPLTPMSCTMVHALLKAGNFPLTKGATLARPGTVRTVLPPGAKCAIVLDEGGGRATLLARWE